MSYDPLRFSLSAFDLSPLPIRCLRVEQPCKAERPWKAEYLPAIPSATLRLASAGEGWRRGSLTGRCPKMRWYSRLGAGPFPFSGYGDSISWTCSFFLRRIPAKPSQFPHNFRSPSRGVLDSFSIEFPLLLQWTKAKGQGKASHACAPGAPKCVGTVGSGPDHFLRIFLAVPGFAIARRGVPGCLTSA